MEHSTTEQLAFIAQMIKSAQRRFYDDSPYYILWGGAVFIASIMQYILLVQDNPYNAVGWAIAIPVALLVQFFMLRKQKREEKIKTHVETVLNSMWFAFGISLFIILFFANKIGGATYPIILSLYAITTFVSGSAFKIRAFVVGSLVCWGLSIVGFFVEFQIQLLLLATGVLFAFIVPGIILRFYEKSAKN
ncbi:MAG: hypothetical protein FGM16_04020 [Flavobacterium sp.]|nr:hypothetical protein [Flavobacterium sp.]